MALSYYEILGVAPTASSDEIKAAIEKLPLCTTRSIGRAQQRCSDGRSYRSQRHSARSRQATSL